MTGPDLSLNNDPETDEARDLPFAPIPVPPRVVWAGAGLIFIGLALLTLNDLPWRVVYPLLKKAAFLDGFFSGAMQFVSVASLGAVCSIVWVFSPKKRAFLFVLLIAYSVSSLVVSTTKFTVGRARPSMTVRIDDENKAWLAKFNAKHPGSRMAVDGSTRWLPLRGPRPWFKQGYTSMPSGHSAEAFVLASFLMLLYPRGNWIWMILAAGTALARVRYREHFPEDVLVGAGLGLLIAHWTFSRRFPYRWFEGLKRVFGRRRPTPAESGAAADPAIVDV